MATIVKRDNGSYSVVYRYVDESGKTKQKWESFSDHKTAKARKAEIESQQINNTFVAPKDETLEEFLIYMRRRNGGYLSMTAIQV